MTYNITANMTSDDILPLKPYFSPHHWQEYCNCIGMEESLPFLTQDDVHEMYRNLALRIIHEYNNSHTDKIIITKEVK